MLKYQNIKNPPVQVGTGGDFRKMSYFAKDFYKYIIPYF